MLIGYLYPILTKIRTCPKILQKISSVISRKFAWFEFGYSVRMDVTKPTVATCFTHRCPERSLSPPIRCWSVLCLLTYKPNRVQSSWIQYDPLRCYRVRPSVWLDSTIQCDTDTALLEFYAKQTACLNSMSVGWSGLNVTGLDLMNVSAA